MKSLSYRAKILKNKFLGTVVTEMNKKFQGWERKADLLN